MPWCPSPSPPPPVLHAWCSFWKSHSVSVTAAITGRITILATRRALKKDVGRAATAFTSANLRAGSSKKPEGRAEQET